ncbi:MAG: endonuclease MutS2 [Halanaerobiales bacterium]
MDKHTLEVLEFLKIIDSVREKAQTTIGKEIIDKIKPVNDIEYIRTSLKEVTSAKKVLDEFGRAPFGGIKDLREIIKKADKDIVLSRKEIVSVQETLEGQKNLLKFFNQIKEVTDPKILENDLNILMHKVEQIENLTGLKKEFDKVLDDYGEIKDSASNKLKSLRREKGKLEDKIRSTLQGILKSSKYKNMLQDQLITRREKRYVVPVKKEYGNSFSGIVHDRSSSGMTIFMEPMEVVKLNNRLREVKSEEENEIYRILQELTWKIKNKKFELKKNLKIYSILDVIFARAMYSDEIDGISPDVTGNGKIKIKKGRHPLLQKKPVPIDVEAGTDFTTLVITGPNTGGKTVSLKTIGLFVLMVQAGFHIPADHGTVISVFNSVFADIGDEQSIEQNLSTFSSHMNKIKRFLKKADSNSLVLLDELGVGTDPREGAALGISILENLKKKQAITVATTHYSQLKSYAYSSDGVKNASVEFDLETLSPTYKLIMGMPGGSNAFEIALRLGLPSDIIERAKDLSDEGDLKVESIINKLNKERKKYRNLKEEVERKKREVEKLKTEYENKLESLKEKKENIIRKTKKEAEEKIKRAEKKTKEIIRDLKEKEYTSRPDVDRTANELREEFKDIENEIIEDERSQEQKEQNIDESIKAGDKVRIRSYGQKGEVININEDDQKATIQAGVMKVTADMADLVKVEDKKIEREEIVKKYQVKKAEKISPRLDIRGERYENAQLKIDKYLDDVFLAGLKQVEIIHGKGTGALRQAVSEVLDDHPHVKSYRLGRQKEGGSGATIVTLGR